MRRARKPTASVLLLALVALQSSHVFGFHFHLSRAGESALPTSGAQTLVAHVHGLHEEDSALRTEAARLAAHRLSRSNSNSGLCNSDCACTHHEVAAFSLLKNALAHIPGVSLAPPLSLSALAPPPRGERLPAIAQSRWTFRPHGFSPQAPRGPPSFS